MTLRVRQQSSTGDMTFGSSGLNFLVDSPACVGQIVKTSLELYLGEWDFDTSLGLPIFQGILGKHSQAIADLTTENYVLGIEGVTDITSFQSAQDRQGRHYVNQLSVETEFSETEIEVLNQTDF